MNGAKNIARNWRAQADESMALIDEANNGIFTKEQLEDWHSRMTVLLQVYEGLNTYYGVQTPQALLDLD